VIGKPEYGWLQQTSLVIIDEAHVSMSKGYSELLRWQGLGRQKRRVPLVGLTATPFKSSEEATRPLVARYGKARLDMGVLGDQPYAELQRRAILAQVKHQVLKGATIELTEAERAQFDQMHRLPGTAEDRLGKVVERNRALLDSIVALPSDWPVLLFATSVEHAETMAALLTHAGVVSRSISGRTETGARQHYIEAFRDGDLRVLTNYGVLTQGFDAPKTRAVYVARPTYSPNLYQQMIGRGLRGPKNGGSEECLIVNVADNVAQYGEKLAFTEFEHLWTAVS